MKKIDHIYKDHDTIVKMQAPGTFLALIIIIFLLPIIIVLDTISKDYINVGMEIVIMFGVVLLTI